MTMTPSLRKLALTAHVTSSVGWLGAAAGFLALAAHGLTIRDAQLVRGLYLAMVLIGWYVIVPLCLASLMTGLVVSLGTAWGLFRHYWVSAKFLTTVASALILFVFMRTLGPVWESAAGAGAPVDALRVLPKSPVIHSGGGMLVLLVNTALSIYKPWGRTRYGKRGRSDEQPSDHITSARKPRGRYLLIGIALLLLLLAAVFLHLGL